MMTLKKWQDEYFDFMKKVEEPMVRYAGKVAEPVARYMPERPQFMAPVPKMTEFVDNGLKFRPQDDEGHGARDDEGGLRRPEACRHEAAARGDASAPAQGGTRRLTVRAVRTNGQVREAPAHLRVYGRGP
jgi:hypothetical protein